MPDYKLKTLDDFGNIPPDRLEICFAELLPFLIGVSTARSLGEVVRVNEMTWQDDGKKNLELRVNIIETQKPPTS